MLMPYWSAIPKSVSPPATVCVVCPAGVGATVGETGTVGVGVAIVVVGPVPVGVGVAVLEKLGVLVAIGRGSAVDASSDGGRTITKMAASEATASASNEPRYTEAGGAADSGDMQRRQTSAPCSGQYRRPHVAHSASAGRSQ